METQRERVALMHPSYWGQGTRVCVSECTSSMHTKVHVHMDAYFKSVIVLVCASGIFI